MEPTVTISLREIEELKQKVKSQHDQIIRLKNQKQKQLTIDIDLYHRFEGDRVLKHSVIISGGAYDVFCTPEGLNPYSETKRLISEALDELLSKSKILKFYLKFPKWVRELLDC